MNAWCLSFHAGYRCAHSGACCTAGWPIAVDPDRAATLRRMDLLRAPGQTLSQTGDGACVFFDAAGGRLCRIQRDAGERLMPVACRNFPRVALRDARGTFITLSHYCPTAARLLLAAQDIRIVPAPASLSLDGDVEGLDATGVLPPLLRPGMLMDGYGYSAWERGSLAVLNEDANTPRAALAIIAEATADAIRWQPGHQCLEGRMLEAFERARDVIPAGSAQARGALDRPVKAYLAAHLFASWAAYQQGGLSAVVTAVEEALRSIEGRTADAAAFIDAVRDADLRLRHMEYAGSGSISPLRHD